MDGRFADNVILQVKFGPIDFSHANRCPRCSPRCLRRGWRWRCRRRGSTPASSGRLPRALVERGAAVPAVGRGRRHDRRRGGRAGGHRGRPGGGVQRGRRQVLDRAPAGAGEPVRLRPARLGSAAGSRRDPRRVDRPDVAAGHLRRSGSGAADDARDHGRFLAHLRALHRPARRRVHGAARSPLRPGRGRLRVHPVGYVPLRRP
ncbi:hypothetical protein V2I01_31925 [Micromonospora sp. BRA006-A]|nr:hypothetical protein [Micromonospora sp. BRA006-A]